MIVLQGATAVQLDPPAVREDVDIVTEGPLILEAAPGAAKRAAAGGRASGRSACGPPAGPAARVIALRGAVVTPGLVCGHHHLYSGLARGILAGMRPSPDFLSTLKNLWWRLDRAIDAPTLALSARIGCLEAIRAGTTAVIDHHASPSFIEGSLEVLKGGLLECGLRGVLCYEVSDRHGEEGMRAGVEENLAFARAVDGERAPQTAPADAAYAEAEGNSGAHWRAGGNVRAGGVGQVPLVEAAIGGHAPFTLSDRALRLLADAVERTGRGLHIHAAEDAWDVSQSRAEHGQEPLERLEDFGLLTPRGIVAHGVHLGEADIGRLNESGAFLAHNGRSNMNNRVGYARRLLAARHAALGTDGIGADMLEELRFAWFKHRDAGGAGSPEDFLKLLAGGNELLERQFGARFGRLEAGCRADLVVWDYRPPTPLVGENLAGHLIHGFSAADVRTVIIDGRIVYEDRRFPFDPEPLYREARGAARRLWERMERLPG